MILNKVGLCTSFQKGNIQLYYKVTGLKSIEDAKALDLHLKTYSFVSNATTDFNTGICKVETSTSANADKIKEAIMASWKKLGYKLDVKLVNEPAGSVNPNCN